MPKRPCFCPNTRKRTCWQIFSATSIGVLLCKSKNDEVVEIAMSRQLSPTLISIYQTKFLDKKLLQRLLHDWSEEWALQHNVDL